VAIPEPVRTEAKREVDRFCSARVPAAYRDEIRLEHQVRGDAITIFELRPPWREDFGPEWSRQKIAQFRFDSSAGAWTLYWADRNGRWLRYHDLPPASDIRRVLGEIDRDPYACFWG
jgi:hypothetical protein